MEIIVKYRIEGQNNYEGVIFLFYEKNNKKDLEEKIEQKRKELYKIAKEKEFCSSEVLSCSKELDKLIVLFQKNFFKNNFGKE